MVLGLIRGAWRTCVTTETQHLDSSVSSSRCCIQSTLFIRQPARSQGMLLRNNYLLPPHGAPASFRKPRTVSIGLASLCGNRRLCGNRSLCGNGRLPPSTRPSQPPCRAWSGSLTVPWSRGLVSVVTHSALVHPAASHLWRLTVVPASAVARSTRRVLLLNQPAPPRHASLRRATVTAPSPVAVLVIVGCDPAGACSLPAAAADGDVTPRCGA